MTMPRTIPPTNEAPSNFLPAVVGAEVVCFSGTSVTVDDGWAVLVVVDEVVVDVGPVGDIMVAAEGDVPFETTDAVVSLEAPETTKQIHSVICLHLLVHLSVKVVLC